MLIFVRFLIECTKILGSGEPLVRLGWVGLFRLGWVGMVRLDWIRLDGFG